MQPWPGSVDIQANLQGKQVEVRSKMFQENQSTVARCRHFHQILFEHMFSGFLFVVWMEISIDFACHMGKQF